MLIAKYNPLSYLVEFDFDSRGCLVSKDRRRNKLIIEVKFKTFDEITSDQKLLNKTKGTENRASKFFLSTPISLADGQNARIELELEDFGRHPKESDLEVHISLVRKDGSKSAGTVLKCSEVCSNGRYTDRVELESETSGNYHVSF